MCWGWYGVGGCWLCGELCGYGCYVFVGKFCGDVVYVIGCFCVVVV